MQNINKTLDLPAGFAMRTHHTGCLTTSLTISILTLSDRFLKTCEFRCKRGERKRGQTKKGSETKKNEKGVRTVYAERVLSLFVAFRLCHQWPRIQL